MPDGAGLSIQLYRSPRVLGLCTAFHSRLSRPPVESLYLTVMITMVLYKVYHIKAIAIFANMAYIDFT